MWYSSADCQCIAFPEFFVYAGYNVRAGSFSFPAVFWRLGILPVCFGFAPLFYISLLVFPIKKKKKSVIFLCVFALID